MTTLRSALRMAVALSQPTLRRASPQLLLHHQQPLPCHSDLSREGDVPASASRPRSCHRRRCLTPGRMQRRGGALGDSSRGSLRVILTTGMLVRKVMSVRRASVFAVLHVRQSPHLIKHTPGLGCGDSQCLSRDDSNDHPP